ncbi:hypothetical protein BZG36_04130 [Bifiguratus adelaidae]|uniref:HIT-type domain-containing protein n=1 Tax=Bifiguratus adelaidae TaxID=1938954 RepID=A0A261XVY3_9FUNG|nr:hypothetical protein BZG36_04130 [Bifiguratus adelaidae]
MADAVSALCEICHKQVAVYTCPRCNLRYCSLPCYKSDQHSACTEVFYKESIEEEIRSKQVGDDEKRRMLELLRKFEEDAVDESDLFEELEEGDARDEDLLKRLQDIDLDKASFDAIWTRLTPMEQQRFTEQVAQSEDTAQNIGVDELINDSTDLWTIEVPWWDHIVVADSKKKVRIQEIDAEDDPKSTISDYPSILDTIRPISELTSRAPNADIAYNVLHAILSYAFLYRRMDGEHASDAIESVQLLRHFEAEALFSHTPFAYQGVDEVLASFRQSLCEPPYNNSITSVSDTLITLNTDAEKFLTERNATLAALSDLYHTLFLFTGAKPATVDVKAAARKVYFYACFTSSVIFPQTASGTPTAQNLITRLRLQRQKMESDKSIHQQELEAAQAVRSKVQQIKIEEL